MMLEADEPVGTAFQHLKHSHRGRSCFFARIFVSVCVFTLLAVTVPTGKQPMQQHMLNA